MNPKLNQYNYDRKTIRSGILHIGVGNFHRAHQQWYTNEILADQSQRNWGICGVMLLESDKELFRKLKNQDGIYTLRECYPNGTYRISKIGSLVELYWAKDHTNEILAKIADPDIKIITLTITEGGYNINRETGEFDLDCIQIKNDLSNKTHPKTVFGFVAQGLQLRKAQGLGPITILSCDNLQHNGKIAKKAFTTFIREQDPELANWVSENVSFPNSMVDRITPATTQDDIERLQISGQPKDQTPVYCEDYIQWVIEDNFKASRPKWENVGVEFTDDVTNYETMKLSLLNASHTLLSYPSFLAGYRKVDQAISDKQVENFVRDYMDIDCSPYIVAPKNTDLRAYKNKLIERFKNSAVGDQISRLCSDGVSKFPVYIMPILKKMINDNADLSRIAYLFATYRYYLKFKTDNLGEKFEINEPWLSEKDKELINSDYNEDFLDLSAFQSLNLKSCSSFAHQFQIMVEKLQDKAALEVLNDILV